MKRISISVDKKLAAAFDDLVHRKGYLNRSEAFRDLVRRELGKDILSEDKNKWCVATLSYVFDHHQRLLADRLVKLQHAHHHLIVSAQHVHLDHDNCIEMLFLRGYVDDVRSCVNGILAQTGVRHGNLHIVPVNIDSTETSKGHAHIHPHN